MGLNCLVNGFRRQKGKTMNPHALYAPQILRETNRGISSYRIEDEMLERREIELVGEIDADLVNSLIRQLRHLQKEDPQAEVTLFINSPGGEVSSGLALYDVMRAVSYPIRTVCLGLAASMGALLFMSGDKRDMLPHSRVMIHDPLVPGGIGGSALSVKSRADDLMRTREITAQIIAEHTGKTIDEVYEITAKDTFFEAPEAIEFGLADSIIDKL